ncbi:phospholipase A2-like isoform X2 [Planococcus citri]|uniref:phospholipase A2-like isoform X2 n=1 Tax=Planococcus citri TaxID=170843 RepID=UPI0031F9EF98
MNDADVVSPYDSSIMSNLQWLRWMVLFLMRSANEYKGSNVEFTFPGTNWCGPGNISSHFDHLGTFVKTDSCCREHDHCPLSISANQTKYGLHNELPYTSSNCACDEAFYQCLHRVNTNSDMPDTLSSELIGEIYFTFLETRCFQKVPPYASCEVNNNTEDCLISASNHSVEFQWKTMPPFK